MTRAQAHAAMVADLERSGLKPKQMQATLVDAKALARMFPKAGVEWAYKIPYPKDHRHGLPPVCRYRVLSWLPLPFGAQRDKPPKYLQPPNTAPAAYFCESYNWDACLSGGGELILVEGEKKAAAGCAAGFNVVGLGGVWSWKSKKHGVSLLPELKAIAWKARHVYLSFDSDASTNPEVARALVALSETLTSLGALVHIATIPTIVKGEKAGLDDFLEIKGKEAFRELLDRSETGELAQRFWDFNQRFAVIADSGIVLDECGVDDFDRPIQRVFSAHTFKQVVAANVQAKVVVGGGTKGEKTKIVQVADEWLKWPARREFERLTFDPGQPPVLNHGTRFNTWTGLAVEPRKGDVKPFRQLLGHLFKESPPEHRHWFECWIGWPLKHLGAKMYSAVGLWGKPGRGKSIIPEKTLAAIYGPYFSSISQTDLEGPFNSWAVKKQFVLVDEVSAEDSRSRGHRFKKLITQSTIQVNEKFVPGYSLPDHVNYFMTSNSPQAFVVEDSDRRFFIHRVPDEQLPPEFFRHYADEWLAFQNAPNFGPGPAALLWYFQNELDYGDFDPKAPPPMTSAKEEMIEAGRHPAVHWLLTFAEGELWEKRQRREVWQPAELCQLYRMEGPRGADTMSINGFGTHVSSAGLPKRQLRDGDQVRRLVAVTNFEKWQGARPAEWLAEYHRAETKGPKF